MSRFAPTAPGSTVFKTATSFFNPGPGTYYQKVVWDKKPALMESKEKYQKKKHKSMAVPPKSIPPSIPMKKVPPNSHSGRGNDRPGPANYNPNLETVKNKARFTDFSKMGKGAISEFDNKKVAEDPGPGMYDGNNELAAKTSTSFNASGCSPMFLSKVPNCKDTKDDNGIPGPGSYGRKKKKNLHQRAHSERFEQNGAGFNTSTKREGFWDNKLEAPFTKGSNIIDGPAPDKYQKQKGSKAADKFNDVKSEKPAFHSTESRSCMKRASKVQSPGPGQYIEMSNHMFIANAGMAKYSSERGIGNKPHTVNQTHFGSKSLRFERGMFQSKDGPAPGQYSTEATTENVEPLGILTKAQIEGKGKGGAVFKSTTNRFVESHPENPNIRILDKKQPNASFRNDLMINTNKHKSFRNRTSYSTGFPMNQKHVGFAATSPRFAHNQLFYGQKLKYTPGPGDYTYDNGHRPKTIKIMRGTKVKQKQIGIFNSSEMKFCRGNNSYIASQGTANGVGPGAYEVIPHDKMIKKSYNHSM